MVLLDLHASKSRILSQKSLVKIIFIAFKKLSVKRINYKVLQHLQANVENKHTYYFIVLTVQTLNVRFICKCVLCHLDVL